MKSLKKYIWLAKLLFAAGLLTLLYSNIDLKEFENVFLTAQFWKLIPIFLLLFINTFLSSYKWHILLKADGVHVKIFSLVNSYLIGSFFNIFLPSSIGGDAFRIYDVSKRSEIAAKGFASVFADRITGFLALAIWALLFSVLGYPHLPHEKVIFVPPVFFTCMIGMIWLLIQQRWLLALLRLLRIDRIPKLYGFVEKVLLSIAVYRKNYPLILKTMLISLVFQFLVIFCVYLMADMLDLHLRFLFFCIFIPLISLIEALPISIFGLGIRDVSYVFFFTAVGATREEALSLPLLYVLITIVYAASGGALLLGRMFARRTKR